MTPSSIRWAIGWARCRLAGMIVVLLALFPGAAVAQTAPQIQLQADDAVALGDVVQVQLSATSGESMPSEPQLAATPGFIVRGQNSAPSQTHISINGTHIDRFTLNVSWALAPQRTGTFRIGPASVSVGGARYASPPVTVTVLAAGQAPPRRRRPPTMPPGFQNPFGLSPFNVWNGLVPGLDGIDEPPTAPRGIAVDPKLSLDSARGSVLFLHAALDKTAAVVGEQVTLSVYQYADISAQAEVDAPHDPSAPDFVKHDMLRADEEPPRVGFASAGGRTWEVRLVRRWALFPLRSGTLTVGPMLVNVVRPPTAEGPQRVTETLPLRVAEPPVARRPPGYAIGDVGRYSLSGRVAPREIDRGDAVAVHVELSGIGNVPSAITTPAREGVEWLTPEVHEEVGPTERGAFGGKRSFDFVVRINRGGDVDLGEVSLPFWDPDQRRYDVARAVLGSVHVKGSAAAPIASANDAVTLLAGLPPARDVLEGSPPVRAHADDSPAYWVGAILAWPLAFGVAVAGRAVGRTAHGAWQRRRVSPEAGLREKLAAANVACQRGDARTADAAIARAIEAATLAHAGVNVRGAVGGELVARLEHAGVARGAATDVADLLRECESARFAPEAADIVGARDRWVRAQGTIRTLGRLG
jgi:BatD DUF11 like domain